MCGIFGYLSTDCPIELRGPVDLLRHRGPDGQGEAVGMVGGNGSGPQALFGFGHRRLSIIDLEGGAQPIQKHGHILIFNGEIYNYVELAEELRRDHGAAFRTRSDSEVLLDAFVTWGKDCLHRLNGMWAFAILNTRTGEIFASRDRMGEKPFYYVITPRQFVFASEPAALLPFVPGGARANRAAVAAFMAGSKLREGDTFFEGIQQLAPGTCLTFRAGATPKVENYWTVRKGLRDLGDLTYPEAMQQVRELLDDATRIRLRSDVEVGIAASAGLDSSVVLSCATAHSKSNMQTLSVVYDSPFATDESAYIHRLVETSGIPSRFAHAQAEYSWEEFEKLTSETVRCLGEPSPYTSVPFVNALYMAAQRDGLKVLLEGQGADELFGGYGFFRAYQPAALLRGACSPSDYLLSWKARANGQRWLYYRLNSLAPYLRREVRDRLEFYPPVRSVNEALLEAQGNSILPSLLQYADRLSMRWGIEVRLPYLDHRLMDLVNSLPASYKIRGAETKRLLRDSFRKSLPSFVLSRPKMGFGNPLEEIIRRNRDRVLETYVTRGLMSNSSLFQPSLLRHMQRRSRAAQPNFSRILWRFMVIDHWTREFSVKLDG